MLGALGLYILSRYWLVISLFSSKKCVVASQPQGNVLEITRPRVDQNQCVDMVIVAFQINKYKVYCVDSFNPSICQQEQLQVFGWVHQEDGVSIMNATHSINITY